MKYMLDTNICIFVRNSIMPFDTLIAAHAKSLDLM